MRLASPSFFAHMYEAAHGKARVAIVTRIVAEDTGGHAEGWQLLVSRHREGGRVS